jgi:hypothetical protein
LISVNPADRSRKAAKLRVQSTDFAKPAHCLNALENRAFSTILNGIEIWPDD